MEKVLEKESTMVQLENLSANQLPELQGWKEKQAMIVAENPFVKIEDNKSYEKGKKARTNLVTARTTIQNQEKLIASKLKDFRTRVSEASKELIAITQPHEEKQQEEVRSYEAKKETERQEKLRIEEERKSKIKDRIDSIFKEWKKAISELPFKGIKDFDMTKKLMEIDTDEFEEFELDYAEKVRMLTSQLAEKITYLEKSEAQRIESERLEREREALEADRKKAEAEQAEKERKAAEATKEEAEKLAKEREELDAERQRVEAEKEAHRQQLAKEQAEKEEAERKAQEEAQRLEAEKRAEALKPDKEKLQSYINSLSYSMEVPDLKDDAANEFLTMTDRRIDELKLELTGILSLLK